MEMEMDSCKGNTKVYENTWKELIPCGRNKTDKLDDHYQLMAKTLSGNDKNETPAKMEIEMEHRELYLEELTQFGNELINNIKSANEKHELFRSQYKQDSWFELQQKLREEAELSLRQFDEIRRKWSDMNHLREPVAVHEGLQRQRQNIEHLMATKDELIERCQKKLIQLNNQYYEDQNRQSLDICALVGKVDQQVKLLKKSYRTTINELYDTIEMEKEKTLHIAKRKWNALYTQIMVNEDKNMDLIEEKQKLYAQELDDLRNQQVEISRTTKIRLEYDAEVLRLEIRKTQANILMNSEKLDYNYQVLQKRNEENITINNQQKRRLAKLNESIAVFKKRLAEVKENNKLLVDNLTLDIQKLHLNIINLQAKAEHFRKNKEINLAKVWGMNFKDIKFLLTRIFEIDRILYEQQLGRKWIKPFSNFDEFDYIRDTKTPKKLDRIGNDQAQMVRPITKVASHNQLRDILEKISYRADFLIEEKLHQILTQYNKNDQCLVKIENIFSALNITNVTAVENLIKYFEPYISCPNCSLGVAQSSFALKKVDQHKIKNNSSDVSCENHTPSMDPSFVLTAINEFTSKKISMMHKSEKTRKRNITSEIDLLQLDKSHVISYWQQFSSYIPKELQNIWKSIEHGLNHHLDVLKKRAEVDKECVFLHKQNAELKYLLQKL